MWHRERIIDYSRHPNYNEYVLFLRQSIKIPCQNCDYLRPTINTFAVNVLRQSAFYNERRTKITGINAEVEEIALIEAQSDLITMVEECTGRVIVKDTITPDINKRIMDLIFDDGVVRPPIEPALQPLVIECDLRLKNQQRLQ